MPTVTEEKNPLRCRLQTNSAEGCEECAADEAEGWMSVDDMGEIGSRICGDYCRCEIIFEDEPEGIGDFEIILEVRTDELGGAVSAAEVDPDVINNHPSLQGFLTSKKHTDIEWNYLRIEKEGVSANDFNTINNYTSKAFRLANNIPDDPLQAVKQNLKAEVEQYRVNLEGALRRLPSNFTYKGDVFRIEADPEGATLKFLTENIGKTIVDTNFRSATSERSIIEKGDKFTKGKQAITYVIKSKNGKSVAKLSEYKQEKEVLFTRGTKFRIIKVEKGEVFLEEE